MYEGVNDDGIYDFGRWARIVLKAIREVVKSEKLMVVAHIKKYFLKRPFEYGASDSVKSYFWEAVIEQLRISGLLKLTYVADRNKEKDDAMLELTEFGKEWFDSSRTNSKLELMAIGLMYAFFNKKGNVSSTSQAVIRSFEFKCDDEKFKRFLYEVRNVLATANNVLPFQVMKDAVIERMVCNKPNNMNEFKMNRYDEFNADRLYRYAPTLVNAITKYKVTIYFDFFYRKSNFAAESSSSYLSQTGELDMGFRLVIDSMPNVRQLAPPHLLPKIQSGENVFEIAEELQITVEQTIKHIVELIKRGKAISLSNLKAFCVVGDNYDPIEIQEKLTDADLNAILSSNAIEAIVDRVHNECPNVSKIFIEVVLAYYQVRHHLKCKRQPYVDVVDDTLVKGKLLIPVNTPKPQTFPDNNAKPWRFNPSNDTIDMDTYFGNPVDDYDPDESSSSDNTDDDDEICSQQENEDDEDNTFWVNNEFNPTYRGHRFSNPSNSFNSSNRQQSESSVDSDGIVEMDVEDMESNPGDGFELSGIIDDCDVELQEPENSVEEANQTKSTTSGVYRVPSFQMSIGSEELNENDLCTAVMDAYEFLYESPTKKAKLLLRRSDA